MLAMQPRVWLPENLESVASRREVILTTALSGLFCSASVLWMTGLKEGPAFWVVALLCTGLIVLAMHLQLRGRQVRRGWIVDFQQGSLTPVGLAQRESIQIDPAQYAWVAIRPPPEKLVRPSCWNCGMFAVDLWPH